MGVGNCCFNCCYYFGILWAIMFAFFYAREPVSYEFPPKMHQDVYDWLYSEYILNEPKSTEWKTNLEMEIEREMMDQIVPDMDVFDRDITVPGAFNMIIPSREITRAMAVRHGIPDKRFQRVVFILKPRVFGEAGDFQKICHTDRGMPMHRIIESLTSSCIVFCEDKDPALRNGPAPHMCNDCYEKCSPFAFENTAIYHQFGAGNMTIAFDYTHKGVINEIRSILFEVQLRVIHLISNGVPFQVLKYPKNRIMQAAGRNMWRDPIRNLRRVLGIDK